jgi:hypothetical protein
MQPTTHRILKAIPILQFDLFVCFWMFGAKAYLEAPSYWVATIFFFLAAKRNTVVSNDG